MTPSRTSRRTDPPSPVTRGGGRLTLRDRILVAAGNLFHEQGIRGVGVEAIAAAAGTNKMTLYRYFASKDDLIAEYVRGIVAHKEQEWDDLMARHRGDPRAQLRDWSRRAADKLAMMEERGAALYNAIAELPEPDHPARRIIQEYRLSERRRVERLCREAGFDDPELAANTFSMLHAGAGPCVMETGLKRIGQHLVQLVEAMLANTPLPSVKKGKNKLRVES